MRDVPLITWFIVIIIVALSQHSLPAPRWLLLHLVFLGAATHAIFVWSQHFAAALLRTPPTVTDQRMLALRLGMVNLGAIAVFAGVPTALWPLTTIGAVLVAAAAIWHASSLIRRMRGALTGRFSGTVRYYVAAAVALPIGALLGGWIAGPGSGDGRLVLAHALINVLGWLGLTVAGTIVTLWPTMLRTRADSAAPAGAARALPALAAATLLASVGTAAGLFIFTALGLLGYLAGLALIGRSLWRAARNDPPRSFATLSVGAALLWWAFGLVLLCAIAVQAAFKQAVGAADALDGVRLVRGALADISPFLAAGFAVQLLIGALSYLIPVVLGGGPAAARVGAAAMGRFAALRVTVANLALIVCALPMSELTRVAASVLYLIAVAAFLPIMMVAMRLQLRVKREGAPLTTGRPQHPDRAPARVHLAQAIAGIIIVAVITAICTALGTTGAHATNESQTHPSPTRAGIQKQL